MTYDVIIIGASFAGLTLAHHLPRELQVLILDMKPNMDTHIESTGLVTQVTYDILKSFTDVDKFVPNKVSTLGVVGPDFKKAFFSSTKKPWMYTTDTPALVKNMAETLPKNVSIKLRAQFRSFDGKEVSFTREGKIHNVKGRFLVGADGAISPVARACNLSQNKKFLVGIEKVFLGNILLGPDPAHSVYHFWFGEFALGYGGWLSPTTMNGKPAFRVGLAVHKRDARNIKKINEFITRLVEEKIIKIDQPKERLVFSSLIPVGGDLRRVSKDNVLLLGDAAGFCGAFAADGIKGALVSGQVAARLIPRALQGDCNALKEYHSAIDAEAGLMRYYRRQVLYRWIWNRIKSNRSFDALFDLASKEKAAFVKHFADNMVNKKSLLSILLKPKYVWDLLKVGLNVLRDLVPISRYSRIQKPSQ